MVVRGWDGRVEFVLSPVSESRPGAPAVESGRRQAAFHPFAKDAKSWGTGWWCGVGTGGLSSCYPRSQNRDRGHPQLKVGEGRRLSTLSQRTRKDGARDGGAGLGRAG